MYIRLAVLVGAITTPLLALAQQPPGTLQAYIVDVMSFVNTWVIPLIFTLAFLFFLINVTRYFIIGGADSAAQEKAKSLALWGIIAFVLMVSIWGIVNLLTSGLGFDRQYFVCPDYVEDCYDGTPFDDDPAVTVHTPPTNTRTTESVLESSATSDAAEFNKFSNSELRREIDAREVAAERAAEAMVVVVSPEVEAEAKPAGAQLASQIDAALMHNSTITEQTSALSALAWDGKISQNTADTAVSAVESVEAYERTARSRASLQDPEVVAARTRGTSAVLAFAESIRGIDDPARRALYTGDNEQRLTAALTLKNTGRISPVAYRQLQEALISQDAYNRALTEAERRQFQLENKAVLDLTRNAFKTTGDFATEFIDSIEAMQKRLEQMPSIR